MGIKLDELIESTELNANDIMHLRTVAGLDKKIAVSNMPAANLAGAGRTTETVKDNADDIIDLAGVGRTTETVKQNADDIAAIGGAPIGVVIPFGGTSAPTGYLLCDGASLLRASYAALFAIIGTAFGTADGTHFNIPDLRGYFLRGVDHAQGIDPDAATRTALQAGGNTGDSVGSKQLSAIWGHWHTERYGGAADTSNAFRAGWVSVNNLTIITPTLTKTNSITAPVTDGVHGIPSMASESRPINVYVNYIIKY